MEQLVAKCFHRFYFRWQYLRENAPLLWPALRRLGLGPRMAPAGSGVAAHPGVPRPLAAADVLRRKGLRSDAPHFRGIGREESGDRLTGGAEAAE